MSSTANATWRRPGVFAGACRLSPWLDGEWNFVSSSRALPSGVCIIAMSARTPSSPTTRFHPATFDGPLALQHESELDEELGRGCEVGDHDADVVHPLDSHVFDRNEPDSGRGARRRKRPEAVLVSTTARPTRTPTKATQRRSKGAPQFREVRVREIVGAGRSGIRSRFESP
jgi:hypothetical protein